MNKRDLLKVFTLMLLFSIGFSGLFAVSVRASAILEVWPGGSIQDAIDSAQSGDTVLVHSGIYYEHLVIGKPLFLVGENKETTIVDGSGENQTVIEIKSSNVAVIGLTARNSSQRAGTSYAGIKVTGNACNITGNIVMKTKIGISVTSTKSRIRGNKIENTGHGIALYSSTEVEVEANNLSRNTVGISLAFSYNNIVSGNRAVNSFTGGHGLYVSSNSYNNTILQNELVGNYHGLWMVGSTENRIIGNTIANNELLGIELAGSSNNTFFHNSLINNPKHVVIDESTDTWDNDYPSGGNYWDDYGQLDNDGDGIGDTPYVINVDNQDRYPMIVPQSPAPINWEGMIYGVSLASNSTISYFRFNNSERAITLNATGPEYTSGFCNVTILSELAQDLWQGNFSILVDGEQPQTLQNWTDGFNTYIHFTYQHSEHRVEIVPDLPPITLSWVLIILTLILLTRTRATVPFKKKSSSKST